MKKLFCFGLGFCGWRAAKYFAEQGYHVEGTKRAPESAQHLLEFCHKIHAFDGTNPIPEDALSDTTHLLITIAPKAEGDLVWTHHHKQIAKLKKLKWIGYLSTTGVYGDHKGGWVTEETPTQPTSQRAKRRVAAEDLWLQLGETLDLPVHILRLPGIYGPKRNPIHRALSGNARIIKKEGQVFSRIHVDDIRQAIWASSQNPRAGAIYNVCDDHPCANSDIVEYACKLAGVEAPPHIPINDAQLSPMALSFYQDCRRVSSLHLASELGVDLMYPTYKEGLKSLLEGELARQRNV